MEVSTELKLDPDCVVPTPFATIPHSLHWLMARREVETTLLHKEGGGELYWNMSHLPSS